MRYFATIRVQLPTGDPEEAKKIAEEVITDLYNNSRYDLNPHLCYVTEQDGMRAKDLINNID